jgi:cytochrome c oxidase cbb3-type subunit 3
MSGFAHSNIKDDNYDTLSLFSNPLFLAMLSIIVFLIIIISVLGDVLKNVAQATKERKKTNNNIKIAGLILAVFFIPRKTSFAQQAFLSSNVEGGIGGLSEGLFYLMLTLIALELVIIAVLINSIKLLATVERESVVENEKVKIEQPSLLEKLNASVAIEDEVAIMFDHEYDGIRELDNDLPPWWKYGFYMTIIFAFVYLIHFHVISTGDLQLAEYNKSVAAAHEAKEAYQKLIADNVSEENVKMITDKHELLEAKKVFTENCAACHGQLGEGGVGPNFTDNYWLHGGSIKDIFISIKYGWPDKGMKSWQADLSPKKINELASYIMNLVGTNPPNQKEKQGDLYLPSVAVPDSIATENPSLDSLKIIIPQIDSVKIVKK